MDCSQLSVEQLRAELFNRGLPISGEVGELCARLQNALEAAPLSQAEPSPAVLPPNTQGIRLPLTAIPPVAVPNINRPILKPGVPLLKPIAQLKPIAPVMVPPVVSGMPSGKKPAAASPSVSYPPTIGMPALTTTRINPPSTVGPTLIPIPAAPPTSKAGLPPALPPIKPPALPSGTTTIVPTRRSSKPPAAAPSAPPRVIQVITPGKAAAIRPLSPVRLPPSAVPPSAVPPSAAENEEAEEGEEGEETPLPGNVIFEPAVPRPFEEMTVAQLRAEAKTYNLSLVGNKSVLIQRIRDFLSGKTPAAVPRPGRPVGLKQSARQTRAKLEETFIVNAADSWRRHYLEMSLSDLRRWLAAHGYREPPSGTRSKREELLKRVFEEIERDSQNPDQHLATPTIGCAGKVDPE